MAKRLVVCCDGTWDVPDRMDKGVAAPSNVSKLSLIVRREDDEGTKQVLHYEPGVGTHRSDHLRGGAFGLGLSANVRNCYRFLIANYEEGDELFFLGFSRGAFTARSTVGLVRNSGILTRDNADRVDEAYGLYRDRADTKKPNGTEAKIFRREYSHPDTKIHFIGVWDTVGSLGIPLKIPFLTRRWSFHDTELSSWVEFAYHAVAIDEQRKPFKPTLWNKQAHSTDQTLEQVWFSGVHCNVGGGYGDAGLSDITLLWMLGHARDRGLALDLESQELPAPLAPDPMGEIRNSLTPFYRLFGRYPRPLVADNGSLAPSALERHERNPSYAPSNLLEYLQNRPADG